MRDLQPSRRLHGSSTVLTLCCCYSNVVARGARQVSLQGTHATAHCSSTPSTFSNNGIYRPLAHMARYLKHRNELVPIVLSQLKKQLHSGPYQVCGSRRIKSTSSTEKVQQVEAPVNVSMEACIKVNAGCQMMWKTVYIAKTRKTPSYDEASHITSKKGATFVPSQTK